jgi:outer membrane protein OmpA-like peptidoglycan-associated protein
MAGWSKRRTQRRRGWTWSPLLSIILGVPLVLIVWARRAEVWHDSCLPLNQSETANCKLQELIIVAAAALGAVGMIILLWWVLSELTGLRRIFEAPWVGVGDDVENAGAMESMLRAAVFIFVLWLCIAMFLPFTMAIPGLWTAAVSSKAAPPATHSESRPNPQTNPSTTSSADPVLIEQLTRTNSTLQSVKELLIQHGQHLSALSVIQKKLASWDPGQGPTPDEGMSTILKETGQIDRNVQTIVEQISEQSRRLIVLDKIYLALLEKSRPEPTGDCFDYTVVAASVRKPETASPSSPGNGERYRTVAVRAVFFDRGSPALSDWAKQDLSWFLREVNVPEGKLAIFGSTDPQGTAAQNAQLAESRARAIEQFVQEEKTQHQIISVKWASEGGAPKSEPYKRVATIRLLQPCQ